MNFVIQNHQNIPEIRENLNLPIEFPFSLDDFQILAANAILKHENVLVAAHTGSGKTVPCIIVINHYLNLGKRVIYTSPVKSLSNQKFNEFKNNSAIPDVGIMTGDIKENPDAQCVIMTTEILRNILYRESADNPVPNDGFLKDVGCVIFDEVHYINDPDRGKNWEESLIMLPTDIKLLLLSATINQPDAFAAWIGSLKQQPIHLIQTQTRPIPLNHYVYVDNLKDFKQTENDKKGLIHIMEASTFMSQRYDRALKLYDLKWKDPKTKKPIKGKGNPRWSNSQSPGDLNQFLKYLQINNYLPSLIFVLSRNRVEQYAGSIRINLVDHTQTAEIVRVFNHHMHPHFKHYGHLDQYLQVLGLLKKGIGIHHSGLIPILKEIVEILFSLGLIQVLFATETFAIGVNMPTKTVVFTELNKWDGKMRPLKTDEYMQMAGRAGRRGLDSSGTIIHFPIRNLPNSQEMKNMLTGSTPSIRSKMTLSFQFILKCMANQQNISSILDSSLMSLQTSTTAQELDIELKLEMNKYQSLKSKFDQLFDQQQWQLCQKQNQDFNQLQNFNGISFNISKSKKNKKKKDSNKIKVDPKAFEFYQKIIKIENEIEAIKNAAEIKAFKVDVDLILQFLNKNQYLDNDLKTLTAKGLIASNINDCNCLILTEMISNSMFEELDIESILPLLSIFIDERNIEMEPASFSDLKAYPNFPPNLLKTIERVFSMRDQLANDEEKHFRNHLPDTNWKLNLDFVLPTYVWCIGGNIGDIYQVCDIYEGNFIKGMLRLQSFAENIIEISDKPITNQNLNTAINLILRGMVSNNSLYVKQ